MPSRSTTFALWTLASSTKHCVSTSRWRLRPLTFLAPSYPRSVPPIPVVLTDWLSTMPALGWGFLCRRTLTRSRKAEYILSHVPSKRQRSESSSRRWAIEESRGGASATGIRSLGGRRWRRGSRVEDRSEDARWLWE